MISPKPARYQHTSWDHVPENIQKYVQEIQKTKRGIYIHGEVGTGKTHIAYAITDWMIGQDIWCKFVNTTELIFDIKKDFGREYLDKRNWEEVLANFKGVLVLDDIGAERVTEYVAEVFYLIMNRRYNEMYPTIFTSNHSLGNLAEKVGDRTASRIIEMCDVVEIKGEDRRISLAKNRKK